MLARNAHVEGVTTSCNQLWIASYSVCPQFSSSSTAASNAVVFVFLFTSRRKCVRLFTLSFVRLFLFVITLLLLLCCLSGCAASAYGTPTVCALPVSSVVFECDVESDPSSEIILFTSSDEIILFFTLDIREG